MGSFLLQEWQAFLRYEELPGASPVHVYLAGLGGAAHTTFASIAVHPPCASSVQRFVIPHSNAVPGMNHRIIARSLRKSQFIGLTTNKIRHLGDTATLRS